MIGVSIFAHGALAYSYKISLTQWDLLTPPRFIWFDNYARIFRDPNFKISIMNAIRPCASVDYSR